jgi:trans-2,3-dihydro-3-hydroxyanthranilate isomerase
MKKYTYRILNVFAESPLAGNPLAVFEDGSAFDDATMQALALQFNLSETTFILPSERASARVRIFTPTFEMPFAGHPTLGTAHVVRALRNAGDDVTLDLRAGIIPVHGDGDVWTLQANPPRHRAPAASREELATMLGLDAADLADATPLWVDTGTEQLIVPLRSFEAVTRVTPRADLLRAHGGNERRRAAPRRELRPLWGQRSGGSRKRGGSNDARAMAYVFARDGDRVLARFFFLQHDAVIEDPGTGSACANLGGWLLATGASLPQRLSIDQGQAVRRPCRLGLAVDTDERIRVSGRVIELGRGELSF